MATHEAGVTWTGEMAFGASVNQHIIPLDAGVEAGGHDAATSPKPLMLVALAGCTGMDVVYLLRKMNVELLRLRINVTGELTEEHPKMYRSVHTIYEVTGNDLDRSKIEEAVQLSQDKYCGVNAMFKTFADVTFEITYPDPSNQETAEEKEEA